MCALKLLLSPLDIRVSLAESKVTMLKRIILLTGPPGIGKTSVFRRTVRELKNRDCEVGGMVCREVREGGTRVGFELMDVSTGQRGWLAHINQQTGPKIGKYTVNLTDLDVLGAGALLDSIKNADVIAVDEIGPMELLSTAFSEALVQAIESNKPLLGTIHYKLSTPLVDHIKTRDDTEVLNVTYNNREELQNLIADKISECLI
ncbi:MAG: nucleoside triphosphatase [Candidatus Bathyarchaeum sp.]|nr:MAG: nucleoside triphosphatase [Candidatus Bathyarchaeum sp.]